MKQIIKQLSFVALGFAMTMPLHVMAQKDKDKESKKEAEQIIITRKGDDNTKVVIELNGDKVTVNGKAIDKNDDITVRRNKIKDVWAFGDGMGRNWNDNFAMLTISDRALLGVITEPADKGAKVQTISKESGAEKAGLKKDDIITKIDDRKIEGPDDLSAAIKAYKPGDKVTISCLRDGKEMKLTAELGKWKNNVTAFAPGVQGYKVGPDFNFDLDRLRGSLGDIPHFKGQSWSLAGAPKLGVSVQDTEDGKGVKVIGVDEDGNGSKAGIKENDILMEVDGKTVNSADEVAKIFRESKDKITVKVKLLRNGKTENLEVKIPRRLKTADL